MSGGTTATQQAATHSHDCKAGDKPSPAFPAEAPCRDRVQRVAADHFELILDMVEAGDRA